MASRLPLLSAQIAAQAYDLAREVRKGCAPSCDELGKFAALAAREVLVLLPFGLGAMLSLLSLSRLPRASSTGVVKKLR